MSHLTNPTDYLLLSKEALRNIFDSSNDSENTRIANSLLQELAGDT